MLTLLPKGVQTKLLKFSAWRFFPFATGVKDTGGKPLAANISANFRKKFKTALRVYSEAWGKLIQEKNQMHCPFLSLSWNFLSWKLSCSWKIHHFLCFLIACTKKRTMNKISICPEHVFKNDLDWSIDKNWFLSDFLRTPFKNSYCPYCSNANYEALKCLAKFFKKVSSLWKRLV